MKNVLFCILAFAIIPSIQSCSGPSVKEELTISEVLITAEGPLFEGANTLQGEVPSALTTWLSSKGKTLDDVEQALVKKVTVFSLPDSLHTVVKSLVIQLAADNGNMVKAAVLNPLPEGTKSYSLQVAEGADVLSLLKQNTFFVVGDAELASDREQALSMKAELVFEITLK
ncbi:MAG TPA: hypothetical protein VK202_00260 [Bacteroidia bacterium]|nr:hypothetical protein [Bacteroidia bacterium]